MFRSAYTLLWLTLCLYFGYSVTQKTSLPQGFKGTWKGRYQLLEYHVSLHGGLVGSIVGTLTDYLSTEKVLCIYPLKYSAITKEGVVKTRSEPIIFGSSGCVEVKAEMTAINERRLVADVSMAPQFDTVFSFVMARVDDASVLKETCGATPVAKLERILNSGSKAKKKKKRRGLL